MVTSGTAPSPVGVVALEPEPVQSRRVVSIALAVISLGVEALLEQRQATLELGATPEIAPGLLGALVLLGKFWGVAVRAGWRAVLRLAMSVPPLKVLASARAVHTAPGTLMSVTSSLHPCICPLTVSR